MDFEPEHLGVVLMDADFPILPTADHHIFVWPVHGPIATARMGWHALQERACEVQNTPLSLPASHEKALRVVFDVSDFPKVGGDELDVRNRGPLAGPTA